MEVLLLWGDLKRFNDIMHIIDNFFNDPYKVRNIALKSEYYSSHNHRWPGYRSDIPTAIENELEVKLSSVLGEKVGMREGSFQYSDKSWVTGVPHFDSPHYTCLTFLNLDSPPNSGIEVYDDRHKQEYAPPGYESVMGTPNGMNIHMFNNDKVNFYKNRKNLISKMIFRKKLKEYRKLFVNPSIASNRFNRTVVFDSCRVHRAQDFFGTNVDNSRLTIISFLVKSNEYQPNFRRSTCNYSSRNV